METILNVPENQIPEIERILMETYVGIQIAKLPKQFSGGMMLVVSGEDAIVQEIEEAYL